MTTSLQKLHANNYHVYELESGDYWFAQNGLRSLWVYAKISKNKTFREICLELLKTGECRIERTDNCPEIVFTMI